ncbi:MAG: ATP synthase subunit b [Phycisphaerae bacterium]|nr:ATP synthase subunit b [Phycisphaerae bacterium]
MRTLRIPTTAATVLGVCLGLVPAVYAENPPSEGAAHTATGAAEESHDGGHGQTYHLLTIDAASAVWTIVIFLGLLAILSKFAFKPIQQTLVQRERFINDSLAKAKQEREEAERLLKQYTEQINRARAEASAIVAEGRRDAENVKHTIEEEAKKEAATTLERAKRELHIATETALQQLHHQTAHLATQIATRLIKKEVSADVHRDLIRESIEELGKAGNN